MSLPTRPRPRGIHIPSIPEEPVFPVNFRSSTCQVCPECGGDFHDADHIHPIPPASPPETDSVKMAPPVLRGTADVDRIEAPVTAKAYMMCAFASFGGIYFGYDIGWISGVMGMKYAIHTFTGLPYNTPAEDFVISASDKSLITSILSAGTFFGALAAGDIADFIGRRTTIIIGCLIFMVGVIMEIVATSVSLLSAGRFIAGLGVGFESAIVILYMSEICPRKVRGALIACYQFCITIGLLLASCVVYGTQDRMDSGSYRIPIGIQFAWALILGGGIACLPESPRYFVKQGQLEKAAKALASVRGQPVDSQFVQQELAEIVANHEYELSVIPQGSYLSSWANCFKGSLWKANSNLRRTILGTSLQMMQQWTGVNFIFFFGTTFFQQLGSISNPFLIGLITTLVNVLSTPISFWTIERFGRRPLLIWGALGMLCCQFLTAILGTAISSDNDAATKAQIAFICLAIAFFASTWGPGAWVLIGEIFPLPIRSRGVGLSTASNWLWNTIIAVITPYMVDPDKGNLGPKVFFVWGTLCTCACIYAYFLVPETKGLSLEQVDKMLEEVNPRNSAGWKPTTTFANEMGLTKGGVSSEEIVVDVEKRGSVN
ncbi:monosaccharide transporter [Aureobasidium pullulans]|nr:monosaccharide transporter [Aureobasidium pullulans]